MSSENSLPAAILAIDVILVLPAIYIIFKHGLRHGAILGWAYLLIFLTLRIVSSAMQLKDATNPSASLVASVSTKNNAPVLVMWWCCRDKIAFNPADARKHQNKMTNVFLVDRLVFLLSYSQQLVYSMNGKSYSCRRYTWLRNLTALLLVEHIISRTVVARLMSSGSLPSTSSLALPSR
jgi:hypothetical protein